MWFLSHPCWPRTMPALSVTANAEVGLSFGVGAVLGVGQEAAGSRRTWPVSHVRAGTKALGKDGTHGAGRNLRGTCQPQASLEFEMGAMETVARDTAAVPKDQLGPSCVPQPPFVP